MTTTYAPSEQDLADYSDVGYFIARDVSTPADATTRSSTSSRPPSSWRSGIRRRNLDLVSILANYDQR